MEDDEYYDFDLDCLEGEAESGIWITKGGRKISISEMTDEHLKNTIKYLKNRIEDLKDATSFGYTFQGEMAQYYGEVESNKAFIVLEWCEDWLKEMKKEYKKREDKQYFADSFCLGCKKCLTKCEYGHEPQEDSDGYSCYEGKDEIHHYFGLSYAHYLVLPRTALQSMPENWQYKFVQLLKELDNNIDWHPKSGEYEVILRDKTGKLISITEDNLNDYERGRRKIQLNRE